MNVKCLKPHDVEINLACRLIDENPSDKYTKEQRNMDKDCYLLAGKIFDIFDKSHCDNSCVLSILKILLSRKPLTPITDKDDFIPVNTNKFVRDYDAFYCNRYRSLIKRVYHKYDTDTLMYDEVKYFDEKKCVCIDPTDADVVYFSNIVNEIVNDLYPITLPYTPSEKPLITLCLDYESGDLAIPADDVATTIPDFVRVAVFGVVHPDGKKDDVNKYYEKRGDEIIEISEYEFKDGFKHLDIKSDKMKRIKSINALLSKNAGTSEE